MRKRAAEHIREYKFFYLIVLLSVILFWTPFMGKGFPYGSELDFHYGRIVTLAESLQQGIFPAKVRPMHMKTYGYGMGFFYPDLLIYPPAALIALGAEYEITVKIYLFLISLIGAVATFKCFERISGRKEIALIGEILVMNSQINDGSFFIGGGMSPS